MLCRPINHRCGAYSFIFNIINHLALKPCKYWGLVGFWACRIFAGFCIFLRFFVLYLHHIYSKILKKVMA